VSLGPARSSFRRLFSPRSSLRRKARDVVAGGYLESASHSEEHAQVLEL